MDSSPELVFARQRNRQLREENAALRGALDCEQKRTARLLPMAEDFTTLQRLLELSTIDFSGAYEEDEDDSSSTANAREELSRIVCELREQAAAERSKADALKRSLLAIKAEAQRVNIACVEVHAAILTGKL